MSAIRANAIAIVADEGARPGLVSAVVLGGGRVVEPGPEAIGLIWSAGPEGLAETIAACPDLVWAQLPAAGIETYVASGALDERLTWTSAKGSYAAPVAEHALMLALALLRVLPERVRATSWGRSAGFSLHGLRTLTIGGGGIATELVRLLSVFDTEDVIVRRQAEPVPGALRTVTLDQLDAELPEADVIFVAAALTPETQGLLTEERLRSMRPGAILVNVARGGLLDTEALLRVLDDGHLGGVGLDVTDPEPLPEGHPLFGADRVIVTPHTADTLEMIRPLLAARVRRNVAAFLAGEELEGRVDVARGY